MDYFIANGRNAAEQRKSSAVACVGRSKSIVGPDLAGRTSSIESKESIGPIAKIQRAVCARHDAVVTWHGYHVVWYFKSLLVDARNSN